MTQLSSTLNAAIERTTNRWRGSLFEPLQSMSNDERGKFGEELINNLANLTSHDVVFQGDFNTNNDDGVFDILINVKRCEVKLATQDVNNNFQHENIYAANVWDVVFFVDVVYDGIFITVLNYDELDVTKRHPIFNRKPTLRKAQSDKFKFDLGMKGLLNGVECGVTIKLTENNEDEVVAFIQSHLA